jgi:predicted DNA-binding protein
MSKKKKADRDKATDKNASNAKAETRQVAVRFPIDLADRLEVAASNLGLDVSNLLRMMVIQKLPDYEALGSVAQERLRATPPQN